MDIMNYVSRCLDVMAVCVEKPLHSEMVEKVKSNLKDASAKEWTPSAFENFEDIAYLKDTKLATQFQEFLPHLPFEMTPEMGDGTAIIQMQNSMLYGMDCQLGFMIIDSNATFAEARHAGDALFLIINGSGHWMHNGNDTYEQISAGNIVYNAPMQLQGTKANHTPLLAFYIVTE